MYIVVGALVLNWLMITLTHLKFKRALKLTQQSSQYPALWAPFGNVVVIIFIGAVLYIMWVQGFKESVLMIPIWITLMLVFFDFLNPKSIDSIKETKD
jgi:aromatic amino acid transport protein AroP